MANASHSSKFATQNDLLINNLKGYYSNIENMDRMISIINGQSSISLRIVDWFTTNYSKKFYTVYPLEKENGDSVRFKVFDDYKLKLKAYSKRRFDPFCRWDRLSFPYKNNTCIQTTIGQLNFFKWALENKIIDYIVEHYDAIDADMNSRNSQSKKDTLFLSERKKRTELSLSAVKTIKKEDVEIKVTFD
tara:strand:- start:195 stop:764 length:570 start_codon:yes stop_codon:yes gene_type:complete